MEKSRNQIGKVVPEKITKETPDHKGENYKIIADSKEVISSIKRELDRQAKPSSEISPKNSNHKEIYQRVSLQTIGESSQVKTDIESLNKLITAKNFDNNIENHEAFLKFSKLMIIANSPKLIEGELQNEKKKERMVCLKTFLEKYVECLQRDDEKVAKISKWYTDDDKDSDQKKTVDNRAKHNSADYAEVKKQDQEQNQEQNNKTEEVQVEKTNTGKINKSKCCVIF